LELSIVVIACARVMDHHGMKAAAQALKETFCWVGLQDDAAAFVGECLQCRCIEKEMVARPIGEALHAMDPKTLVHCVFLSMPTDYIRVVVDDASGICQLTWHDSCHADTWSPPCSSGLPFSVSSRIVCLINALTSRTK
jgi:hypothetical protein